MTIAVCYVSPEGIVLGADSTTTMNMPGGSHYFDHSQKVFEVGENSTLAIATWGLSGLAIRSHRLLIALYADELAANPRPTVEAVANGWVDFFWPEYDAAQVIQEFRALAAKPAFNPAVQPPNPQARTQEEENIVKTVNLGVGFCLGGHLLPDREPAAYFVWFDPLAAKPAVAEIGIGQARFFGAPNFIMRQIQGFDMGLKDAVLNSGHWTGTAQELDTLLAQFSLTHPGLMPIRDAIDYVNSSIVSTIKSLKFSHLSQICGGPIELAVITSDRRFRWVRHKEWDSAVQEGEA